MKRTLFLAALMSSLISTVYAATYTDLTHSWCDEVNNVIYNGNGYFAVESGVSTSVDLTIDLAALKSYVNSNDYSGYSSMLKWDDNAYDYGIADNADMQQGTGERTAFLSGLDSNNNPWNASTNIITYATLSSYATNGCVTLNITNGSNGVTITTTNTSGDTDTLYTASALKYGANTTTNGYYVNLNYITAVSLNTASTLNTDSYVPPVDYSQPFISSRTGTTNLDDDSIGRVTFLGDSITHGVNDQSYRWQFFKILTDNGIESEFAGPRNGYYSTPNNTSDQGSSYGGEEFNNVHLAQASGRTHNIISGSNAGMSGVNYGGHSTASTGKAYDSNTWFCMMGTNDLLSDTNNSNATNNDYCVQMQKMLGGSVVYEATDDAYTWKGDSNWGNMGKMVSDVCGNGDTFYMLSILPWGTHTNHTRDLDHFAAQEFNRNLEAWTKAYSQSTGKNVVYVDVTRGMVDQASSTRFMGHDAFFNHAGDRLHPNEQGSLIMAGNLAQAMGIGGRTAGLARKSSEGWASAADITLAAGSSMMLAESAFTMENGYTIDFGASFGNGATGGWLSSDLNALSISLGDGTYSGTLNLSEGYIMWGRQVLFCSDNSTLAEEGNLRIAWHNGNEADNVLGGYYVWLGDMLIGQGLQADTNAGLNGILVSATGAEGSLTGLTWTNTAYAPTTMGTDSSEYAYITRQDTAAVTTFVANTYNGVDFSQATEIDATSGLTLVTISSSTTNTIRLTSAAGWTGMSNCNYAGQINVQVTGTTTHTVFGAMGGASNSDMTLEVREGAIIGDGTYSGQKAAIAGSYGGGNAKSFSVYVNGGEVKGNIVGGAINGTGTVNDVKIVVNAGSVAGDVNGGSTTGGTVDNADIVITGGSISGNVTQGTATKGSITVVGNTARIGGNITADSVTLRNVATSGSANGFDTYAGTIITTRLTLDNVQIHLGATLSESITSIELVNASNASAMLGDHFTLSTLVLANDSTFSAFNNAESRSITSANETTLTVSELQVGTGATLNANLVFQSNSVLTLDGTLTMGSDVTLSSGMALTLSDAMLQSLYSGGQVELFTGVDKLIIDGETLAAGATTIATFACMGEQQTYMVRYSDGAVALVIPEPATTTLSLAALALLCLRRRRG